MSEMAPLKYLCKSSSGARPHFDEAGEYTAFGAGEPIGKTQESNVVAGDILVGRVGTVGSVRLMSGEAWATDNTIVLSPDQSVINPYFLFVNLSALNLSDLASTTAQPLLTFEKIRDLKIPLPPLQAQRRIADYLDRETGQIDAMIDKLGELEETLVARRSRAISRATTRGIDGADVVDTGNAQVGFAPEHWLVTRFGAEFDITGGQVDPREDPWSSMVLVAPNHIVSHRGKIVGRETARDQGSDSGKYLARKGQILYSKIRPALNKVAVAQEDCLISADMYAMSSKTGSDHRYLTYMLLSSKFHGYVSEISMRVKMPKVNREELSISSIVLPPLEEQRRIADHLDDVTSKIDAMLSKVAELKGLLIERRAALITDVVTGRKEVA